MRLSTEELTSICERASTLTERLSNGFLATGGDQALAERRLARWIRVSAGTQPQQLTALLDASGRDGISQAELLGLLGPVRMVEGVVLPQWASFLNELVERVAQNFAGPDSATVLGHGVVLGRQRIPFAPLHWSVADFAWSKLGNARFVDDRLVDAAARRGLQEYLVRRVSRITSGTLYTSFLVHSSLAASGMMQHFFGSGAPKIPVRDNAVLYKSFVAEQGRDGLSAFFVRNPVAARLVVDVTQFWIEFVNEFLLRLQNDLHELAKRFNQGKSLGRLQSIRAGLSDPHHGGRTVLILRFRAGRVVYKPRSLAIDRLFNDLLEELNFLSPEIKLGGLRTYERDGYGWQEFVRHSNCGDEQAAKRYYQRAGALAGLLHWLHGIDFHRENVIAAGEYPMLIDLECLAHPLRSEERVGGNVETGPGLGESVLRSGLLPLWQARLGKRSYYDNSGLAGPIKKRSFLPVPTWVNTNTDRMRPISRKIDHSYSSHRATLRGRPLSIAAYEAEVVSGYQNLIDRLQPPWVASLAALRSRLQQTVRRRLKRPTFIYGVIIQQSMAASCLEHGIDRSISLMSLPCMSGDDRDWIKEYESLEELDIPYFLQPEPKANPMSRPPMNLPSFAAQTELVRLAVRKRLRLIEWRIQTVPAKPGSVRPL